MSPVVNPAKRLEGKKISVYFSETTRRGVELYNAKQEDPLSLIQFAQVAVQEKLRRDLDTQAKRDADREGRPSKYELSDMEGLPEL